MAHRGLRRKTKQEIDLGGFCIKAKKKIVIFLLQITCGKKSSSLPLSLCVSVCVVVCVVMDRCV